MHRSVWKTTYHNVDKFESLRKRCQNKMAASRISNKSKYQSESILNFNVLKRTSCSWKENGIWHEIMTLSMKYSRTNLVLSTDVMTRNMLHYSFSDGVHHPLMLLDHLKYCQSFHLWNANMHWFIPAHAFCIWLYVIAPI